MNSSSTFPALSFQCPKVWSQMEGDEHSRFCGACERHVHNLSFMTEGERRALLSAQGESPCVSYYQYLDGTPVDVTALPAGNPLKRRLTRAAALSIGAMALLPAACATRKQEVMPMLGVPLPPPAHEQMQKSAGKDKAN